MTTNRLAKSNGTFKSGIRARDWARMAREKGYAKHAEAWEQADAAGWDDLHYDPYWNAEAKRSEPPIILSLTKESA